MQIGFLDFAEGREYGFLCNFLCHLRYQPFLNTKGTKYEG